MLVLTRKLNQTIRIADDIEVRVVKVSKNRVRLAICAPPQIPVFRQEIAPQFHDACQDSESILVLAGEQGS